jgi:hypothetical protein
VDRLGIQSSGKIARKRDEGYNSGNITPIRARKLVTAGISLFENASGGKSLPDCRMELQGLQGKNESKQTFTTLTWGTHGDSTSNAIGQRDWKGLSRGILGLSGEGDTGTRILGPANRKSDDKNL